MALHFEAHAVVGDEAGERRHAPGEQRLRAVEADGHDVHLRRVPAGVAHLGVEHRQIGGHPGDPHRAALQLRGRAQVLGGERDQPADGALHERHHRLVVGAVVDRGGDVAAVGQPELRAPGARRG